MADKNLKARIVNKNGTSVEWEKATSFIPKKGELILYTDLNKIKIGDGVTVVGDLPFSDDDKVSKAGDTMTGDLKMGDSSGTVKGSLVDTTDGIALSSLDGACLKVGAEAITVCDYAGGTSQIKGVKAPVNDTDAANKKYVDDAIPTAQIEELSNAIVKAEPFFVEVTMTNPSNISANKTFAEIKTASDAGKLCYARITNSRITMPLIAFDLRVDKRVAVFSSSNLLISTFQTISLLIAEDNSVSTESFNSQSQIEATGLLKGSGNGTITAAVAGTDYAAAEHTHDTYTATEIDTMWNAVTIS